MNNSTIPTGENVREAENRIKAYVRKTPVITCSALDRITGARLFFKAENFQKVGAFKFRGASNAVFSLSEKQASRGVATHSSGNHAQALALAARLRGIPAYVVMPENAPRVKVSAVRDYGGIITFCAPTLLAREETLKKIIEKTGAEMIHPYNDARVIAGQGTAALELIREITDLDIIMTPVGGGGLTSGTLLAVTGNNLKIKVIGTEPENADDAIRSLREGKIVPADNPRTIADGLRTSLGTLTFPIISQLIEDILPVSEDSIIKAMRLIWERAKIIVEPSAAVPCGALLENAGNEIVKGKKVGIILSGGNVDLDNLPFSEVGCRKSEVGI